ncbi:MAG: methyltransferase domain-containing protein [Psychromonas sp.]|nr:methyltransferase domain-containing protein [Alteromonadales bacterium]MCP5078946.1 methyltransferase domain-containing protein [Psychromonas sp.]
MKICIVAHYAYGALTGEESGHIGGVERQTALLSGWLAKNGHDVTVITWDEGGDKVESINDIKIIKLCKVSDGLPFLRFFAPRWSSLLKALQNADADIYYHNCAEYITGQVAMWCKFNNKPFIYSVASMADCEAPFTKLTTKRDQWLFLYGLKNASKIICQTNQQKQLLNDNYHLNAKMLPMPGTPPDGKADPKHQFSLKKVIWVGRIQTVKRIEWLIDIAEKLPDINFEVIGPTNHNHSYMTHILPRANRLTNVTFLGKISRQNIPEIYKNASVLLNTSIYEGFPNTYLEAWSYGVPTISTIDPDNLINSLNLGLASDKQDDLVVAIKDILNNQQKWQLYSSNCLAQYQENYTFDASQKKFEAEFLNFSSHKRTLAQFNQQSKNWSEYYDSVAQSISHLDIQVRAKYALQYLRSAKLHKNDNLLDIGCATGNSTQLFKKATSCETFAIDFAPDMITQAKINDTSHIHFQVADATELPFDNKFAMCIVSLGTLEYIPSYAQALTEYKRVLKDDGQLIISVPNKHSLFRKLRNMENKVLQLIKRLFTSNAGIHAQGYHNQWDIDKLTSQLNNNGFSVTDSDFFTYGFLSPKLVRSRSNLALCRYLNEKVQPQSKLAKYLAHSLILRMKKTNTIEERALK